MSEIYGLTTSMCLKAGQATAVYIDIDITRDIAHMVVDTSFIETAPIVFL